MREGIKQLHNLLRRLGCFACMVKQPSRGTVHYAPSLHHIQGVPRMDWAVIPLCPFHHQYGPDAIHVNKSLFRGEYGHEWDIFFGIREVANRLGKWENEWDDLILGYAENAASPPKQVKEWRDKNILNEDQGNDTSKTVRQI